MQAEQRAEAGVAGVQALQWTVLVGQGLGGKAAPTHQFENFLQGGGRQVGAVATGRQGAHGLAQVAQLLARLLHAPGEGGGLPGLAGVLRLERLAVGVEQAPVEVEAARLVPAEGAAGAGEAAADRAGGVEADQVQALRGLADLLDHRGAVRQRFELQHMTVPGLAVELQVRVGRQQRQGLAQLRQGVGQALAIHLRRAAEGYLQLGMAAVADQLQAQAGLLHVAGLAHLGLVETDEFGGFGAVAEAEFFAWVQRATQPFVQRRKLIEVVHQAAPPNTSTWLNTQAGVAWPTRTTWLGSPLPQCGVPSTSRVLASPTAASAPQNRLEVPR